MYTISLEFAIQGKGHFPFVLPRLKLYLDREARDPVGTNDSCRRRRRRGRGLSCLSGVAKRA